MTLSFDRFAAISAMAVLVLSLGLAGVTQARDIDERRLVRRSHVERSVGTGRLERDRFERARGDGRGSRFESGRRWRAHDRVPEYRENRLLSGRRSDRGLLRSDRRDADRHGAWSNRGVVHGERHDRPRRHRAFRDDAVYPSMIVGSGTFSGDVSIWYEQGNGSYFTIDRHGVRNDGRAFAAEGGRSRSRIIAAGSRSDNDPCSYEAGVCVIRGP